MTLELAFQILSALILPGAWVLAVPLALATHRQYQAERETFRRFLVRLKSDDAGDATDA